MTLPPECASAVRELLHGLYAIGGGDPPELTDAEIRQALGQEPADVPSGDDGG